MKTHSPRALAVAALFGAMALGAHASPAAAADAAAAAPPPVATILDVRGPVAWHAIAEGAFHPAHGGERLFAGAVVRTGESGFAHLAWRNGGDFRLLPVSELAIPADEGVLLRAGKVWAEFGHKLLVPFFFQGPSATAVVRGTILGVEVLPLGGTHVSVLEGRVEVSDLRGRAHTLLEPGQAISVSPFGELGPVGPVGPRSREFERGRPSGDRGAGPSHGREKPAEGPARRFGFDWLQHNRASDRLEDVRRQERHARFSRFGGPGPRPAFEGPGGRGDGDGPGRDSANAVSPDRAFPAGRPPDDDPSHRPAPDCLPGAPPAPGTPAPACPPPPTRGGR